MLHFDAWHSIQPLAEYNNKQASHARVTVLFYIAMRASSGYFWGSVETIANDCSLSQEAAGRLMRDLEEVGAVEVTAHTEIPPHVRAMIETSYGLKPAKKVWRVTGSFRIEDKVYQYLYIGDGGVGNPNNSNVGNSNYWKSQHNIIEIKDKEENKEIKDYVAPATQVATHRQVSPSSLDNQDNPELPATQELPHPQPKRTRKPKTTPPPTDTPPLLVNLTNEKLGRSRIEGHSDERYQQWLQEKPVWSLFAGFHVFNKTGVDWDDRSVSNYLARCSQKSRGELFALVQAMGGRLDDFTRAEGIVMSYEWLQGFAIWYKETVLNKMAEPKYCTKLDTLEKNLGDYLTYLNNTQGN